MKRGGIYLVTLDPTQGREQQGGGTVLVVPAADFNSAPKLPVVLPITSGGDLRLLSGGGVSLLRAWLLGLGALRNIAPVALRIRNK